MSASVERRPPDPPRVLIVGGGLAGLAAAVALVDRGLRITLLEARPRLGGRASSFTDALSGELIDNAQHVSLGCCTNLADFCRRVGTGDLFRRETEIVFVGPGGKTGTLRGGWLPAPLHLFGSFARFGLFSIGEKLRLGGAVRALCSRAPARPGETFETWLRRHAQTDRLIDWFWGPLLVSALNERLDRIDPMYARQVVVEGLMRNRAGYAIQIPRVPLGELYGTRLEQWLGEKGVLIERSAAVRSLAVDDDGSVCGVVMRGGARLDADMVLLAVPFERVSELVPERLRARWPALQEIGRLEAVPITGIHLWLDRKVSPHLFAVILGRTMQWVFDHSRIRDEPSAGEAGQYLQLVVSAAYELAARTPPEIRDIAIRDLEAIWPDAMSGARVERWRVVTEHQATYGVRPGIEPARLPQRTPIDGLFLAGDWTATGWPATMEGAVRSGYHAAEELMRMLGRPTRFVASDLAEGGLARLILGPRPATRFVPTIDVRSTARESLGVHE